MPQRSVVPPLLLLLLAAGPPAAGMPADSNTLDDHSLFSRLQTCFTASGMAELEIAGKDLIENMPSVAHRREILQTFLDCCSKQDFPGIQPLEASKQNGNTVELSARLKLLQQKIQAIYKKYLMGSSVGLNMHSSA